MTNPSTAITMPTRRSTRTTTTRRHSTIRPPRRPTPFFFGEGLVVGKVVGMIAVLTAVALLLPESCETGTVAAFAVVMMKGGASLRSRAPFGGPRRTTAAHHDHPLLSGPLHAKQRRRKRRDDSTGYEDEPEGESTAYSSPAPADDDLPDFVLAEEAAEGPSASTPTSSLGATSASPTTPRRPESAIASPKSMDAAIKEAKSVRELLGDRSLEKKMVFDDAAASTSTSSNDEPLPDLVEMARKTSSSKSTKRQEQASRKAALQAAASSSSDPDGPNLSDLVSKLPLITNDKGEITPQKVLEAGTWLGIFLLVGWELYINSPLFDRAGPMAPVVY